MIVTEDGILVDECDPHHAAIVDRHSWAAAVRATGLNLSKVACPGHLVLTLDADPSGYEPDYAAARTTLVAHLERTTSETKTTKPANPPHRSRRRKVLGQSG